MTLNGVAFDEALDGALDGDPELARDVAAGYLVQLGYGLVDRRPDRVHLKFAGRWFTTDPEEQTHHAYVSLVEGKLRFEFTTGIVASYWTEADRKAMGERVAASMRAVRGGSAYRGASDGNDPVMEPCAFCGKRNPTTAAHCSVCGATPRR